MNNQFNLKRFGMLFKKHTTEHYKTYLMALVVLIGVLSLVTGIANRATNNQLPQSVQSGIFLAFLFLAGTIFTSTVFVNLGDKKSAIASLTLPASHFEKFLVGWLYSYILFQIAFIAVFYAVMSVFIIKNPNFGPEAGLLNIFSGRPFLTIFLLIYAMLHAIALWGAIFFEKQHFIKTAFSFFLLIFLLALANRPVMASIMHRDLIGEVIWSPVSFMDDGRFYTISIPDSQVHYLAYFGTALALVLWVTAYYKLKEKEA